MTLPAGSLAEPQNDQNTGTRKTRTTKNTTITPLPSFQ
jgi:hypothetical protein